MSRIRKALKIAGGVTLVSMVARRVVKRLRRRNKRRQQELETYGGPGLVGRMCRIRSQDVNNNFGAAVCHVDGHVLNIDVRCLLPNNLTGGSAARIVAYHEGADTYEVVVPSATPDRF